MKLITDLNDIPEHFGSSIMTLGNFDGVHLGHHELIKMVNARASETGTTSVVVTFRPHPLKILAPEKCPPLISIYEEKIRLIQKLGVDVLVKIPFTRQFSGMSPGIFIKDVLCDRLKAREIFVGYNYRFGKGREGNIETLRQLGLEFGFTVNEVNQISLNGEEISSTKIRDLLIRGNVEHAARLLGRTYAIDGIVVRGDGRGKKLGFPTANIACKHEIIPSHGVYAVHVLAREKYYPGIANIGRRPTFEKNDVTVEVHVFEFDEDLYGEEVNIYFIKKLRDEVKFPSAEKLIDQINLDMKNAGDTLKAYPLKQ